MPSSFMHYYRRVQLQHITLASCLSINSRPMGTRFLLAPPLPLLPQLGLAPATPLNSKVQVTSSHLTVATLGQAAMVVVEVLAAMGGKELAAVVAVVMVLAGAVTAGVAGAQLRARHRGRATSSRLSSSSSSSRGSRQVRLSLQAAGLQPTMDMCGTCLSGCQQPPWHSSLQPWGINTCSTLVRPIPPVLHRSCRSALSHSGATACKSADSSCEANCCYTKHSAAWPE